MVRLEIILLYTLLLVFLLFTFQYGQIRNLLQVNLLGRLIVFTFQYGQIRNPPAISLFIPVFAIYIPVWLDQKCVIFCVCIGCCYYLHSSMVRLEIRIDVARPRLKIKFTFQYGQIRNYWQSYWVSQLLEIYIPVWLDQKSIYSRRIVAKYLDLHSSMVRLEMEKFSALFIIHMIFTFQYGQIRNSFQTFGRKRGAKIYIPVWLDQKYTYLEFINKMIEIYIPVWLDQKLLRLKLSISEVLDLHSSMVRLEIFSSHVAFVSPTIFTFQYGQIRNFVVLSLLQYQHLYLHSSMVRLEI